MNTARLSLTGLGLVVAAACTTPVDSGDDGVGGNAPGTGGATSGSSGTGGTSTTGGAGGSTGGASATGGAGGTGGSTGGASAAGGAGGTGGSTGGSTGGTGVAGLSSTGGAGTSGSAGAGVGGTDGGSAGMPAAGGAGGMGGSDAGGMSGASGSAGTGSTSVDLPPLVTSAPNAYWKTDGALTDSTGTADVTVNDTQTQQNWEGMGGAFNELGWQYLSALSQTDRDTVMQALFGADGAHFALGRIPMGSSDYAVDRYTYDETANDTSLASFSIDRDKMKLIPYIKAAMAINPNIRFWGSPWTPPTWMKSSPYQSGNQVSAFDGGTMKSDDSVLKAFAQYFIKFVQGYQGEGIHIEAVAPQNEPNFGQNYPSCLWATSTYVTFVGKYLGPAFMTAGIDTKIMLGTMSNGDSGKDPSVMTGTMGDATAKGFISMLGLQWGMDGSLGTAKSYNLPLWQTEHKCGNYPWMSGYKSTAPNDKAYADESWGLIKTWIKGGVTAYSAWNMVLDPVGKGIDTTRDWAQNALILADPSSKKVTFTPTYYVFRHISQFAQPGGKVVSTSGGDALAFKNPDNSLAVVMYNSGGAKTMTVAIGGKKVSFDMPGSGWATVYSK